MKKKLWVSRDNTGYNIWRLEPSFDVDYYCHAQGSNALYEDYFNLTKEQFKKALHGCDVKLAMNQLKEIELTITAEVKEI